MNPLSLGRRIAALLLLVLPAHLGCEPPPLSRLEAGFAFPQLWPPPRQPLPPTSRKRIDLTAVPILEPIQLVDGPPMKLETLSLGKPKVLLPRAKGTYYPAEHPLSDRRAMVRRIREDEHGRTMEQYEGYLVDFEDGVVERFDSISPYEQYSEAGIGFAWKSIDGVKHRVLVHADGQVVPMWPETDTAPDLLLHPIWRQAWIFGTQEFPTVDPSDDPEQTERRSVYIHWTDLRKPPPSGPKVALPFVLHFDERVINNETESVHGPRPKQQADVPFVVRGNLPGCSTIELDRDGGFHCRYGSYRTLAQGWSYTAFDDRNLDGYVELQNRETGEVQIFHGENEGDDCEVTYSVMDPPRLLVVCDGADTLLLWTPEKTVAYPPSKGTTGSDPSWDGLIFSSYEHYEDSRGEADYARRWVDLEHLAVAEFAVRQTDREHTGYPYHGKWLFTQSIESGRLHASSLGDSQQREIPARLKCPRVVEFADWHRDSILISCWGPPPNPKSLLGLDPDLAAVFPLPGADNRESIVTATHVLTTRRNQREVVVWARAGQWPTSSLE